MKSNLLIFLFTLLFCSAPDSFAQEVDIVPYLKMVEQGKLVETKSKLLELKSEYPKSSNLIFLEAVLTDNGQDAVILYQNLADNFPKNSYADAALFRLYSYYFALGLYNTADKNLQRLKKDYPESPYIKIASLNRTQSEETTLEETQNQTIQTISSSKETTDTYTVQAGAFTNSVNANSLKKEVENAGMVSFIKEKNVAGTVFNVVFVGKFKTKKEAEDFLPIANARFKISGRVVEINQ